jgi:hypothetical protein
MGTVVQLKTKEEKERERLIAEAREQYASIFPTQPVQQKE